MARASALPTKGVALQLIIMDVLLIVFLHTVIPRGVRMTFFKRIQRG
jgi:hypothetical protein